MNSLNTELLKEAIHGSGITMTKLAETIGITRESLYNKVRKDTEFTVSEINGITKALGLSNAQRSKIFFGR